MLSSPGLLLLLPWLLLPGVFRRLSAVTEVDVVRAVVGEEPELAALVSSTTEYEFFFPSSPCVSPGPSEDSSSAGEVTVFTVRYSWLTTAEEAVLLIVVCGPSELEVQVSLRPEPEPDPE